MTKIDFYKEIKTKDKTIDLKENLLELFDNLLRKAEINDDVKLGKLARLRAQIEITLTDL